MEKAQIIILMVINLTKRVKKPNVMDQIFFWDIFILIPNDILYVIPKLRTLKKNSTITNHSKFRVLEYQGDFACHDKEFQIMQGTDQLNKSTYFIKLKNY